MNEMKAVHFIGIGGVSMSALAALLHQNGVTVSGSDMQESPVTQHLRRLGIRVYIGHKQGQLGEADTVVYNARIHADNAEYAEAVQRGLQIIPRAALLGSIMKQYSRAVAVAGTHGKSTTTSMLAQIFCTAQWDPTVMNGASLPCLEGGSYRLGKGDLFLCEACEYTRSFLHFHPTLAVVLNVEEDHLDYYRDLEDILEAFRDFLALTGPQGTAVICADQRGAVQAAEGYAGTLLTYGIDGGEIRARNIRTQQGRTCFSLCRNGEELGEICLAVCGKHNVYNALAAASVSLSLGLSVRQIAEGLASFHGCDRRLQRVGQVNGAEMYIDDAHHPTELKAALDALREMTEGRVIALFQPHTYSRVQAFAEGFAEALKGADVSALAEVFSASEKQPEGVSSQNIADLLPHTPVLADFEQGAQWVRRTAQPGDAVVLLGAGDIPKVAELLR